MSTSYFAKQVYLLVQTYNQIFGTKGGKYLNIKNHNSLGPYCWHINAIFSHLILFPYLLKWHQCDYRHCTIILSGVTHWHDVNSSLSGTSSNIAYSERQVHHYIIKGYHMLFFLCSLLCCSLVVWFSDTLHLVLFLYISHITYSLETIY